MRDSPRSTNWVKAFVAEAAQTMVAPRTEPSKLQSLRDRIVSYGSYSNGEVAEDFKEVVSFVTVGLMTYRWHVEALFFSPYHEVDP